MIGKPSIPSVYDGLPDSAFIGSKDLIRIYGCSLATVKRWEREGKIPSRNGLTRRIGKTGVALWRLGDIRNDVRLKNAGINDEYV